MRNINSGIRKCTSPGDKIYILECGRIKELTVDEMCEDFLIADDRFFNYEDVGLEFYLTKKIAMEHIRDC